MRIVHCPTDKLIADFYTKPLQGKQFCISRNLILNLDKPLCNNHTKAKNLKKKQSILHSSNNIVKCETCVKLQECVENKIKSTYRDVLCGGLTQTTKDQIDNRIKKDIGLQKPLIYQPCKKLNRK